MKYILYFISIVILILAATTARAFGATTTWTLGDGGNSGGGAYSGADFNMPTSTPALWITCSSGDASILTDTGSFYIPSIPNWVAPAIIGAYSSSTVSVGQVVYPFDPRNGTKYSVYNGGLGGWQSSSSLASTCGTSILLSDTPPPPPPDNPSITLVAPTGTVYTDFGSWTLSLSNLKPTTTYTYCVQYDTAPFPDWFNEVPGCSAYSYGKSDAVDSYVFNATSSVVSITKSTPIDPYTASLNFTNGFTGFYSPIYVKVGVQALSGDVITWNEATTTLNMQYGQEAPQGAPGLRFAWPITTTTPVLPFDQGFIFASGLASSSQYRIRVVEDAGDQYPLQSGLDEYVKGDGLMQYGDEYINQFGSFYDFGSSSVVAMTFYGYVYDMSGLMLASTSVSFDMLPFYHVRSGTNEVVNPNGASSTLRISREEVGGIPTGNVSSSINRTGSEPGCHAIIAQPVCKAPDSITDIGGGLAYAVCKAGDLLLIPGCNAQNNLSEAVDNIKKDFPFSYVFGTINIMQAAASGLGSIAVPNSVPSSTGDLYLNIWGMSIPVLTSSTLSNFVGEANKNLIFKVEDAIAWVAVGFTALKIIF